MHAGIQVTVLKTIKNQKILRLFCYSFTFLTISSITGKQLCRKRPVVLVDTKLNMRQKCALAAKKSWAALGRE